MVTPLWRRAVLVASLPFLLSTGIAQVTESPFTVPPGKVLVEMDGLKLSFDRSDGSRFTGIGIASTLVSAGLTSFLDVQAGVDLFVKQSYRVGGARDSQSGIGDLAFRMKWTFWRNEKLGAALAAIPYVKLPSGTGGIGSDAAEGGIILPWAMQMPGGITSGAMFQWDVVRNDAENGYDAHWHATGFVQKDVTSALAFYGEATLLAHSTGASKSTGTVGVGALLQVTKSVQLDYELQRAINSRTPDWIHVLRVNWSW
jgi:hypothetical protein